MGAGPNFPSDNKERSTALHYAVRALDTYLTASPIVTAHVFEATQLLQLLALHGARVDLPDGFGATVEKGLERLSPLISPHIPAEALEGKKNLAEFVQSAAEQYKLHAALSIVDDRALGWSRCWVWPTTASMFAPIVLS